MHLPCPNVAFVLICGQRMAMIVELTTTGFGYINRKCTTNQHKHTFEPEATSTNNKFYMCIVFKLSYKIFNTYYVHVLVQLYYFTCGTIWYFSLLCCVVIKQRKAPNCFKCKTEPQHTYNTNT